MMAYIFIAVALRKESVDRNFFDIDTGELKIKSLSARRAWIEISIAPATSEPQIQVALRKESVDRNININHPAMRLFVALRKESVDRNNMTLLKLSVFMCRSPQGERG